MSTLALPTLQIPTQQRCIAVGIDRVEVSIHWRGYAQTEAQSTISYAPGAYTSQFYSKKAFFTYYRDTLQQFFVILFTIAIKLQK